jgi:hypothetical protein
MQGWDAVGLRWTPLDAYSAPSGADLGDSVSTDAGRTECGFDTVRNGECAGQRVFRWAGMGSL